MAEVGLAEQLGAHSSRFASMVELIPAKYYLTTEDASQQGGPGDGSSKYWTNKRKKTKDFAKKAKRMKLDPETQKSVAELQAEANQEEEKRAKREVRSAKREVRSSPGTAAKEPLNGFSVEHVRSSSLTDLRGRLKEKLESLRCNRKVPPEKDAGVSEKAALKRQKKMEKRKKDKELQKKKLVSGVATNGKTEGHVKKSTGNNEPGGRIVFNKLDFSTSVASEMPKKKSGKRDYKRLLAKAEADQRKLEELKKNDERRGKEVERKLQWQKALDKARGEKLKDDPKLLRRTTKRLEKRKQKSKKEWVERKDSEKEAAEKRQEKRKKNIQHRADQVKARKIKKRSNKSVARKPGF